MHNRFARKVLPERFCNFERLLARTRPHEPRPYAAVVSRYAPDHMMPLDRALQRHDMERGRIGRLRRATALNREAIERTVKSPKRGGEPLFGWGYEPLLA
jgi:hypothetical protein